METITLHTFCKQYDLPKTSVRRWLLSEGFDTGSGLTVEAQKAALAQFKPTPAPTAATAPDAVAPSEVLPGGALAYYGVSDAPVPYSTRGLSLGDLTTRISTREERRAAVGAGFQGLSLTREERRALIEQAALLDADDDAETYAAVYQTRLDKNLQRHAVATVAVLGKDIEGDSSP